jgi:hypothetical protein
MHSAVRLFGSGGEVSNGLSFIGEPAAVSGDVWLENDAAEALQLRRAVLLSASVPPPGGAARDQLARITVPRSVGPHARQLLSVSFDLDPTTPPGTYDAAVLIEGLQGHETFPARIVVLQNYSLSIDPDPIVCAASLAGTFSGELVVTNDGNVPVEVLPMGAVQLEDPWREPCCCCCHGDSREASDDGPPEREDFGVLVIDNERMTVPPGSSRVVGFTAAAPGGLRDNLHLRARPRIGTERFDLDILTGTAGFVPELLTGSGSRPSAKMRKKKRS